MLCCIVLYYIILYYIILSDIIYRKINSGACGLSALLWGLPAGLWEPPYMYIDK